MVEKNTGSEFKKAQSASSKAQSSRPSVIQKQVGKISTEKGVPSIHIGKNIPPNGADLVVVSVDQEFTIGPLKDSVLRQIGVLESKHLYSPPGGNFRIGMLRNDTLLGEVVSISNGNESNEDTLKASFHSLLKILMDDFFLSLEVIQDKLPGILSLKQGSIWIPLMGTGSARIPFLKSAQIIKDVLDETLLNRDTEHGFNQIYISLRKELDEKTEKEIHQIFQIGNDPISEMPDQFHADRPVDDIAGDDLGRDAIARTIALNVSRVWGDQIKHSRPFAVHLSGRWGSGKSSILNFLRTHLEADTKHTPTSPGTIHPPKPKGWVVVNYNAWQMQESGPPWWSLRNAVADQGYKALDARGYWLRLKDWTWRHTQMHRQWFWIALVLLILAAASYYFDPLAALNDTKSNNLVWIVASSVGALSALFGFLLNFTKTASDRAEALRTLHADPTAHLQDRFAKLIKEIERPVAVFIDDLDRCETQFVVDLLQSLQTAYAEVPVLYVVASDRDWIVAAYNQVYKDFKEEVSQPGLPLGYLFVKKIFQLSVPVPDLADTEATALTRALMKKDVARKAPTVDRETRVREITEQIIQGNTSGAAHIQAEALSEGQDLSVELMEAMATPQAQAANEHRLLDYIDLFDKNPRAVKRLINALTFRQGYVLAAAQDIPFDTIARWTVLTLRYPYAADHLSDNPDQITKLDDDKNKEFFPNPENIAEILTGIEQSDVELIRRFG